MRREERACSKRLTSGNEAKLRAGDAPVSSRGRRPTTYRPGRDAGSVNDDGAHPCALRYTRYATANPTWAAIIIRYMWRHEGWFSVAVSSSGFRTMSQRV